MATLKIEISELLQKHIAEQLSANDNYLSASDYIEALIRRDLADAAEEAAFLTKLRDAANAPEERYSKVSAEDIKARSKRL